MTVKEFIERFNNLPCDYEEIAEICLKIEDDQDLLWVAKQYLEYKSQFENKLDEIGFEFG